MNRIYQGKVTKVEISEDNGRWKPFDDDPKRAKEKWQAALWRHHELFQDAVNYYTLALAAMADGLGNDSKESKAASAWREQVIKSWVVAQRRANLFPGPHVRLAKWLGVDPNKDDAGKAFDACAKALLKNSSASKETLAKALLQILKKADKSDLNKFCVSRLPFLCSTSDKLNATPNNIAKKQERKVLKAVREVHEASTDQLATVAKELELGYFVTQMPKKSITGEDARKEAEKQFESASKKAPDLKKIKNSFVKHLDQLGNNLKLPKLGRKPKGVYPFAVVFKLFPVPETWEALKRETEGLRKKAEKTKDAPVEIEPDFVQEARTETNQPVFDYFTNRVLHRKPEDNNRAVWFEFDLAAFIEAVKAPHRYFQDTLIREEAAESLRKKKSAMEGRGGEVDDEGEEDYEGVGTFGFEGDKRIDLLRELVTDTLGYVAEAETPGEEGEPVEYTIQERTLRGFEDIKEKWCKLAEKNQATQKKLLEVLAGEQAKHRDDFGSATLYRSLAEPEFHPIWRDDGTEKWHAADPLSAWRSYKELCFELEDKERPIRFTPAHAEHSPRYFIIPKQGRFKSQHQASELAFTCGMALNTDFGLEPKKVRITYSAPRLKRDGLRCDGKEDLESVPWLQPMMASLGLGESPERVNFANCRITLQPNSESDIQLTFPVEVKTEKIQEAVAREALWKRQFNLHPEGESFYNASLRWPHEKQPSKPPEPWYEQTEIFRCLSIDLGQRDAGAFARLLVHSDKGFGKRPSRVIGEAGGKQWRAALERSGLFRLPGEDAQVWRAKTHLDSRNPNDSGKPFDFRVELHGGRGRRARDWEADETVELMRCLEAPVEDGEHSLLPDDWRDSLTFPEQNDKLLVAMRRYQSRISRMHRWCWFLKGDSKRDTARQEIADCDDLRLVTPELKRLADIKDPCALATLEVQLRRRLELAPEYLVRIANRILPLRWRSWRWERHPQATAKNPLHRLTRNGPSLDNTDRPVWIRGQRGLSMKRIEQIEELRKRFQSLNQTMRRKTGDKPPIRRDESVPDPCPDLLDKLDNIKKQRVNQTAHMILAEALGLRLAPPPSGKKKLRKEKDLHGVYEKLLDKNGKWIGPVDFIVIEDLSRYLTSQGRARRENSRLMRWCHRAVRDKLKELCEVFGLPVLETPAAYSSRFCSRSGAPGFRATEVTAGFTKEGHWAWLAGKKDGQGKPTDEAERLLALDRELTEAQEELEREWIKKKRPGPCPKRTLLAPLAGGPIFVPVVGRVEGAELQPAVVQADINAAINIGLRAVADPRLWAIHPRLRTQRDSGDKKAGSKKAKSGQTAPSQQAGVKLLTREKRKFGEKNPPKLVVRSGNLPKGSARQPNFFADMAGLKALADQHWQMKEWTTAVIDGQGDAPPLIHGKSFWGCVKAAQWHRIDSLNKARLVGWRKKKVS